MPFRNLASFVSFLESKNDLVRIKAEVDPVLEITEIVLRVIKHKGPALLFENVKGSSFPLLVNALGAERRVEWALGRKPSEVGKDLAHFAEGMMPPSPQKIWEGRSTLGRVLSMRPKFVSSPPVRENVIEPANLDKLPIAQSWPEDGGRFITFPLVVTKSPDDQKQNMGVYRMHVYGPDRTGMHWQIGKGGGYHYQQAERNGKALPLTVVLGADPILMMCGILPLPEGISEIAFSGFLRGEATRLTQMCDNDISVPAEADFVLEGEVPPQERKMEGPYGDHFGHYSLAAEFPVFHIKRIWHRKDAIFPIAVVGKPPQEDQVIGDAVQEMLLPLLKIMHPEITDLWAYMEAGFHNLIVASVNQRFEKEAVKTGLWILGEGQLALSKCVVLVDSNVNARSFPDVLKAIAQNFDPTEDFILLPGTSQDTLDFTSFKMNLGSKMILDATSSPRHKKKQAVTGLNLDAIRKIDNRIQNVRLWEGALLAIQVSGGGREILEKMLSLPDISDVPLVAAISTDVPLEDPTLLMWGLFTRFDCARDTFFQKAEIKGGHPAYQGPFFIDATWKTGYPKGLEMDKSIIEKVTQRWAEYGLDNSLRD